VSARYGLAHVSCFMSITYVDLGSQGGMPHEDLMKIWWSPFELPWTHYHWNEACIDEDKEIWWYSSWSRLERVFSTWLHH